MLISADNMSLANDEMGVGVYFPAEEIMHANGGSSLDLGPIYFLPPVFLVL